MAKSVKAWVIKSPNGVIYCQYTRRLKRDCKYALRENLRGESSWDELEKKGWKVIPISITEIPRKRKK